MEIVCKDCKKPFEFSEGEEKFLRDRFGNDFKPPARCRDCRNKNKKEKGDRGR